MTENMLLPLKDCRQTDEDWGHMRTPPDDHPSFAHCIVTTAGVITFAEHDDRNVYVLSGHGLANVTGVTFPLTTNDIIQVRRGVLLAIEPMHHSKVTVLVFRITRPTP